LKRRRCKTSITLLYIKKRRRFLSKKQTKISRLEEDNFLSTEMLKKMMPIETTNIHNLDILNSEIYGRTAGAQETTGGGRSCV
jgi:hypothetical protein